MSNKCFVLSASFVLLALLIFGGFVSAQGSIDSESSKIIKQYKIDSLVNEIENIHCKMADKQMKALKLSAGDIERARDFCAKPTNEKVSFLAAEFSKIKQSGGLQSRIVGYENSYSCYYSGLNTGIPTYQDLGLSSSSCTWHDPNPSCRIQGSVACLWGCTRIDAALGWHTKYFSSKTALENAIKPKGYFQANTGYYSGLSYARQLPYGYRYEVQGPSSGVGSFHSEGPEPDPSFNWYAFLRGWYPAEVGVWHIAC